MKKFGYFKASSVSDAASLLTRYGGKAKVLAGGTDLLYQMKNGIRFLTPEYLIDITGLNMDYIRFSESDGLRIGAASNVVELATHPDVKKYFTAVSQAANAVASPQIRNQATVAGNVLQQVWCWYLRNNYDCWRNGGNVCYAPYGDNRYYHSLFGGNLCYAVHASDMSPALFAFDATATVAGPSGSRTISMDQLIPGVSIVDGLIKETSLEYNEILTEVHVPTPATGTRSSFYKVSDRGSFDFAMASAAIRATLSGNTVSSARLVLGSVANKPWRVPSAEQFLSDKQLTEGVISEAADIALSGATPLTEGTGNAFRVESAKGAVKKALRALVA